MKTDSKETKPVSFRLPIDVFDVLHDKGLGMELSAHELACKIVKENYQVPNDGIVVKEAVTCSKQVFLPLPSKQVFHFTLNDLKSICFALTGHDNLPCHVNTIRTGIDEVRGLTRIGEDLWEVLIETSNVQSK